MEFLFPTRVKFREIFRLETSVGHIAAPATGDTDFLQVVWAFFKDRDACVWGDFSILDRGEKTGCAAADDGEVEIIIRSGHRRKRVVGVAWLV
jgi:hypothetical protein